MRSDRRLTLIIIFALAITAAVAAPRQSLSAQRKSAALKCAVCEIFVDEMNFAISRTEDEYDFGVQTRWRVDEKRRIPYARTEFRLLEIVESEIISELTHYGIANHTDRYRLIRAPTAPIRPNVSSNEVTTASAGAPSMPDRRPYDPAQFTHTSVVTATIKLVYERMTERYLEEILLLFHKAEETDVKRKLCIEMTRSCTAETLFDAVPEPTRVDMPTPTTPESAVTAAAASITPEAAEVHPDPAYPDHIPSPPHIDL